MDTHETFFLVYEVVAIVSAVACIPVVLSFFLFKEIRNKLHFKLACTISFCYMTANFAAALGEPPNASPLCEFQGLVQNYFNTAGVLWTTGIAYMLYLLVTTGTVNVSYTQLSYFCWGAPLISALLPYISAYYGRPDDSTYGWCYLRLREGEPEWQLVLWVWVSFYFWLFLSLLAMTAWTAVIYHRVVIVKSNLAPVVRMARGKLRLYPIALVICYCPIVASRVASTVFEFIPQDPWAMYLVFVGNLSLGFVITLIFFGTNPVIKRLWIDFLFGGSRERRNISNDGSSRTSTIARVSLWFGRGVTVQGGFELRPSAAGAGGTNSSGANKLNSTGSTASVTALEPVDPGRPSFYGADADGDLVEIDDGNGNRDSFQSQANDEGFGYTGGGWGRSRRGTETECGGDAGSVYTVDVENPMYR